MTFGRIVSFLCLLLFGSLPFATAATVDTVTIGIDGVYKNGKWTPITVTWYDDSPSTETSSASPMIAVQADDSDGVSTISLHSIHSPSFHSPSQVAANTATNTATVYARFGQNGGAVKVAALHRTDMVTTTADGKDLLPVTAAAIARKGISVQPPVPVLPEKPICLVIGDESIGLSDAITLLRLPENLRPQIVGVSSWNSLPDSYLGYDSIEWVVLNTAKPDLFHGVSPNDRRLTALKTWVRHGGRLLFNVGKDSEPFLSGPEAIFRGFLPGPFVGMKTLRQSLALETFAGSDRAIVMDGSDLTPFFRVPHLENVDGVVALTEGDVPLVVRTAHGFGTITFLATDLAGAPLVHWKDRGLFLARVLDFQPPKSLVGNESRIALTHLGFSDMSGQLRSVIDRFDSVTVVPFSVILVFIVLYTLAVSLGDWYLVHRILRRPRWTWISFPLLLVLFGLGAWWLARWNRPPEVVTHSIRLIDVDLVSGMRRDSIWTGLYSPHEATYGVNKAGYCTITSQSEPSLSESPLSESTLSWLGLTGSSLGGMSPKTLSPTVWPNPYLCLTSSDETTPRLRLGLISTVGRRTLVGVPIQARSTKSFFTQFVTGNEGELAAGNLVEQEGLPTGELVNHLGMDISQGLLVYGRWVIFVGEWKSGEVLKVDHFLPRRELKFLLSTGQSLNFDRDRVVRDKDPLHQLGYNMYSDDPFYIFRIMTFCSVLGGNETIGLANQYQNWTNWSPLLRTNRAVFIGVVPHRDGDGEDWQPIIYPENGDLPVEPVSVNQHTTVVRQVIPVYKEMNR